MIEEWAVFTKRVTPTTVNIVGTTVDGKSRQAIENMYVFSTFVWRKGSMNISDWLDKEETKGIDASQITLPDDMSYDEVPDETIYFKEINPCGILCPSKHPFATVERFGRWYFCRGRNKEGGIHSSGIEWKIFTRDRDLAVKTAESHIKNT